MYQDVAIKICGLTRVQDVELTLSLGADFLGFIVYPKSPRRLTLEKAVSLADCVPLGKRVLVDVETNPDELKKYREAGFEYFQIHTNLPLDKEMLARWSDCVGLKSLWLSPRLSPDERFPEWLLEYVDTFVLDTYSKTQIGGTGHTGDFNQFASLKQQFPDKQWILAGGLSPNNILNAIRHSTADRVDVNSGVEIAPGEKDPVKLRDFFQTLRPLNK